MSRAAGRPKDILDKLRFVGEIQRGGTRVPAKFEAKIDAEGILQLKFDALPINASSFDLWQQGRRGQSVEHLKLTGSVTTGETLASDSFLLTGQRSKVPARGRGKLLLKGACAEATIALKPPSNYDKGPLLLWYFRKLRTFRRLSGRCEFGEVVAAGAVAKQDQLLTGTIGIQSTGQSVDEHWWQGADAFLEHAARVMSFATGVALVPFIERQITSRSHVLKVIQHGKRTVPFLAPFHFLNLGPIFKCACECAADNRVTFKRLSAAIDWYVVSTSYDELRLLTAMTALENIIELAYPAKTHTFVKRRQFDSFAKKVRSLIDDLGLPAGIKKKMPEFNRPSLKDKIHKYVKEHGIADHDLGSESLDAAVDARNDVVHRGIYSDEAIENQTDIWRHILVVRELIIRIFLKELGFNGNYFSVLHGDKQLSFPSCQRIN